MHFPVRRLAAPLLAALALLAPAAAAHAATVVAHGVMPDAVVDRDGLTHLVWNESKPGGVETTHYCQIPRGATACTAEQRFTPDPDGDGVSYDFEGPKVMITPFGEVVLLTNRDFANYIYVSDDGGATFTGPTKLGTVPPGEPSVPTPTLFDGADRRVITIAAPTGGIHLQGAPLGQETTAFAQLSNEDSYDPSVVQRARGQFVAAWVNLSNVVSVRTYDCPGCPLSQLNDASKWTQQVTLADAELPRLADGPNGTFLFYRSTAAGPTDGQWFTRRVTGTALGPPQAIGDPGSGSVARDVIEAPDGYLHFSYVDQDNALVYRVSPDGTTFSKANVLAPGPDFTISHARVAARTVDAGFTGFAFWESNSGGEQNPPILAGPLPDPATALAPPPAPGPAPGGGGPAPPPPPPLPPAPPAACRTLSFAAVDVIADACLTRDGDAYVATGGLLVNGLRVELGSGKLRLDPKARRITSSGATVTLKAGDTVLYKDDIDWQLPKGSVADLGKLDVGGAGGDLLGFPLAGSADLKLRGGGAELGLHLGLPALFGGVTGDVTLRADNLAGVHLRELHVKVGDALIGPLQIKDLSFDYDADAASWAGGATLILPPQPPGPSLESHIGFSHGDLDYLRNELTLPGPGIALDPFAAVYLHKIRFSLETKPLRLSGGVTITAGPSVAGVSAVGIDGDLTFTFPDPPNPAKLRADGTVNLFEIPVGKAFFELAMNGYVAFGGSVDLDVDGFGVHGGVDGWFFKNAFNVGAKAQVCLGDLGCGGGEVVISSEGFAGCVYTDIADFGAGYHWGDGFPDLMFTGCDVGPYRAKAAQAGGATSVTLGGGLPSAYVAVRGDGAPPDVALVGPGGERIAPAAGQPLRTPEAIAFHVPDQNTTYFALKRPAAGTWRVEPAEGSAPVKQVLSADGLAAPSVRASVTRGAKGKRVLRYRVTPQPGQRVVFAEQGKGAAGRIGVAKGSSGTLRFTPADGPGGRRTIVAQVSSGGVPRKVLDVARYVAPPPARPATPKRLRARRSGTRLAVTWASAAHAVRYQVRVTLSDGRRLLRIQRARRLSVPGLTRTTRATVVVRGLRGDGTTGRAATARVAIAKKRR